MHAPLLYLCVLCLLANVSPFKTFMSPTTSRTSMPMGLFDNLFGGTNGNKQQESTGGAPSGPPPGEFPRAVIVARGDAMKDSHLDLLDDLLAVAGLGDAPVVIMGESDRKDELTLRQLLMTKSQAYLKRDHQLPATEFGLTIPSIPILLFSGTSREPTRYIIDSLKRAPDFPSSAFAIAVKPALDKPFKQLFTEIQRDFSEEALGVR